MRSGNVTFVDTSDELENRKAYCEKCEDIAGQFNRLVPRFVNGVQDDKFKICSYCGTLYPIHDIKLFTEYEPKGYISDNPFDSGSKISVQSKRRQSRKLHRNKPLPNEDIEIPKFAGKKDVFLEDMVLKEGAIINKIHDTVVEEVE